MKIVLKINDIEYSRAFQNSIASYDKDILVEVCSDSDLEEIDNRTIIVSDAEPETLDKGLLKQAVFLTVTPCDATQINRKQKYNSVFKYLRMPQILSFIEEVYYSLTGEMERIDSSRTKVFSVCSESNAGNAILCKALARQITYRHGGEILILPLRYINEYFNPIEIDFNKYSRMLYYLKSNKKCVFDSYLFKDSYGINYISISRGINPINMLEIDELLSLIKTFCEDKFKTIILDIGDCFNDRNIEIMSKTDNILFFKKAGNFILDDLPLSNEDMKRSINIDLCDPEKEVELIIDDYVRKIYGIEGAVNESMQKRYNY